MSTWTQHMLVAEGFAEGRVALAGDANPLFIPAGGPGMNTSVGDAFNLARKLAALVQGWGGQALFESYATERSQVVRRNLAAVHHAIEGVVRWRRAASDALFEPDEAGEAARAAFAALADPLNCRVYEMHGTELG